MRGIPTQGYRPKLPRVSTKDAGRFYARENGYPAHVLLISRREGVSCNPCGIGARVRHDCSDGVG